MTILWLVHQLAQVQIGRRHVPSMRSARRRGQVMQGAASETLLAFFRAHPATWYTQSDLMRLLPQLTRQQICYGLSVLRRDDQAEAYPDAVRNPRYLRYRLSDSQIALLCERDTTTRHEHPENNDVPCEETTK